MHRLLASLLRSCNLSIQLSHWQILPWRRNLPVLMCEDLCNRRWALKLYVLSLETLVLLRHPQMIAELYLFGLRQIVKHVSSGHLTRLLLQHLLHDALVLGQVVRLAADDAAHADGLLVGPRTVLGRQGRLPVPVARQIRRLSPLLVQRFSHLPHLKVVSHGNGRVLVSFDLLSGVLRIKAVLLHRSQCISVHVNLRIADVEAALRVGR